MMDLGKSSVLRASIPFFGFHDLSREVLHPFHRDDFFPLFRRHPHPIIRILDQMFHYFIHPKKPPPLTGGGWGVGDFAMKNFHGSSPPTLTLAKGEGIITIHF